MAKISFSPDQVVVIGMQHLVVLPDKCFTFSNYSAIERLVKATVIFFDIDHHFKYGSFSLPIRAFVTNPLSKLNERIFGKQKPLLVGAFRAVDTARKSTEFGGVAASLARASNESSILQVNLARNGAIKRHRNMVDSDLAAFRNRDRSSDDDLTLFSEGLNRVRYARMGQIACQIVDTLQFI